MLSTDSQSGGDRVKLAAPVLQYAHGSQRSTPTEGAVFEVRLEDEEGFPDQRSRRRVSWADEIECTKAEACNYLGLLEIKRNTIL